MKYIISMRTFARLILLSIALVLATQATHIAAATSAARDSRATSATPTVAAGPYTVYLPLTVKDYNPSYVNPFGVDMYVNVNPAEGLLAMQAAGAKRVTTLLGWPQVEPVEGVRNWSSFDTKVRNARAAGMDVFVLFSDDPQWAWTADRTATIPEKRLNFVRAMVDRYDCDGVNDAGPNMCVHYWSFYAEPDAYYSYYQTTPGIKGYWGRRGKEYARMLAGVANVIHHEDPQAKVLIGGVAYDYFTTEGGPFVQSFLGDVLTELNTNFGGAARYIDEVAFHFYPISFPSLRAKLEVGRAGVPSIRAILQQHGVGHLPVSVPETGFWSSPSAGSSETQQAAWLVRLYVQGISMGVKHLEWYEVFDLDNGRQSWGLFRGRDLGSPKPSYFAYQTMTRELTGATFVRMANQGSVEQYVFRTPHATEKTVVWTNSVSAQVTIGSSCLRLVTTTGMVYAPVRDGDPNFDMDKTVNGRITLGLTVNQPRYIENCS